MRSAFSRVSSRESGASSSVPHANLVDSSVHGAHAPMRLVDAGMNPTFSRCLRPYPCVSLADTRALATDSATGPGGSPTFQAESPASPREYDSSPLHSCAGEPEGAPRSSKRAAVFEPSGRVSAVLVGPSGRLVDESRGSTRVSRGTHAPVRETRVGFHGTRVGIHQMPARVRATSPRVERRDTSVRCTMAGQVLDFRGRRQTRSIGMSSNSTMAP
jgi:hypothetical protein